MQSVSPGQICATFDGGLFDVPLVREQSNTWDYLGEERVHNDIDVAVGRENSSP